MPNTTNENVNPYEKYFTIETSGDNEGQVSLKNAYRGDGVVGYPASIRNTTVDAQQQTLPEMLVIPDIIGETPVASLAPGMFAGNLQVKRITLPTTVTTIPKSFCRQATNLRSIHGTEIITTIETGAFWSTRIKRALFPKLTTLGVGAFVGCAYLEVVDIGQVETIPRQVFANCALLREVIARNKVTSIETLAFFHTHSLRGLPLLADVTSVTDNAFLYSRIATFLPVGGGIQANAFPQAKHTTNFWSGVKFTPCHNRIPTKLSHLNSEWMSEKLQEDSSKTYAQSCPLFAIMHIHSAITGQHYSHPRVFVNELTSQGISQCFEGNWTGETGNVEAIFTALGYRTEVRGSGNTLNSKDYKALVDALAHGAYIYTQVPTHNDTSESDNHKHAVVLYGINNLGEVCVLDSNVLHEEFRADGLEENTDVYTYTIPYQNIVNPSSKFIIVYPTMKEPAVEWTGFADANEFTLNSNPSEYPENQVTISHLTDDDDTSYSESGILTAYRVGDYAFRTFMSDTDATLRLQIQSKEEDKWLDWIDCNQKDFTRVPDNQILENTLPSAISGGVSVCVVSRTDSGLPGGGMGYMTTYHLHSPSSNDTDNDNTANVDIIREEWQPMMNHNKYVRYATIGANNWGPWHFFAPDVYNPETADASGEGQ